MANRYRITFVNGDDELTPPYHEVKASVSNEFLFVMKENSFAPDKLVKTYVMANIRSWEPVED